jgi:uncharacterized membrane protein HdeD (DUF308 family)
MAVIDSPILLIKKLGGLLLLVIGLVMTALGANYGSTAVIMLGTVAIVAGIVLLALKIYRRNQAIGS